jgi:hypothetical protein
MRHLRECPKDQLVVFDGLVVFKSIVYSQRYTEGAPLKDMYHN